jgi:hypothetical protein
MSLELYVFMKKSNLPSLATWQGALDKVGFGVALDSTFNPIVDDGFVPCSYNGSATGFEFSLGSRDELVKTYPGLKRNQEGFDTSAVFVWGGGLNECVSAVCSAAVLTQLSDGLMYDPQEAHQFTGSEAVLQGRKAVQEL